METWKSSIPPRTMHIDWENLFYLIAFWLCLRFDSPRENNRFAVQWANDPHLHRWSGAFNIQIQIFNGSMTNLRHAVCATGWRWFTKSDFSMMTTGDHWQYHTQCERCERIFKINHTHDNKQTSLKPMKQRCCSRQKVTRKKSISQNEVRSLLSHLVCVVFLPHHQPVINFGSRNNNQKILNKSVNTVCWMKIYE